MKYLCLVYVVPAEMAALSATDSERVRVESIEYDAALRERGMLIASGPLKSVETATTVRSRGGKVVMVDGPYAESKEVLGGFLCIDVDSRDAALDIAAKLPMARFGSIEVRELRDVDDCCS